MKSNIFIPKKINVGFQNRSDTYTKKLAYIIYYDEKGVLRKERSWDGWRDKEIDNIIFDNEPTSGFVLNKKVGDYCSDWNHRQAYVRVYDSRDFEFEITIENLLYILENASSIKGKGLEGEFIYGWDGKDLLLIPTSSPDYFEISKYNEIVQANTHIKAKELILGATYMTKSNEEWIYMGRFDYWKIDYDQIPIESKSSSYSFYGSRQQYKSVKKDVNKGKHHYFIRETKSWNDEPYLQTLQLKSVGDKFISIISTDCVENYAELFDSLESRTEYSPYDESKDEIIPYTLEEFKIYIDSLDLKNQTEKYSWFSVTLHSNEDKIKDIYFDIDTQLFYFRGDWKRELNSYSQNVIGDIEELHNRYKPTYKNEYLENSKLYRRIN